jgi:hypothetical protein
MSVVFSPETQKAALMDISSGLLQRAFDHEGEINMIVVVLTS